jgi:hypothetical protein
MFAIRLASSPSRIHVMPSAITTRRCQRDQPSASSRPGTVVSSHVPCAVSGFTPEA